MTEWQNKLAIWLHHSFIGISQPTQECCGKKLHHSPFSAVCGVGVGKRTPIVTFIENEEKIQRVTLVTVILYRYMANKSIKV